MFGVLLSKLRSPINNSYLYQSGLEEFKQLNVSLYSRPSLVIKRVLLFIPQKQHKCSPPSFSYGLVLSAHPFVEVYTYKAVCIWTTSRNWQLRFFFIFLVSLNHSFTPRGRVFLCKFPSLFLEVFNSSRIT